MMFEVEDAMIVKESDAASLVVAQLFGGPEWIPKSVVHEDSEIWKVHEEGTLGIHNWFAERRGWI